jgi:hypothetical protein
MPPGKAVAAPTGPGLWSTPSAGPAKPKLTASPEGRSVPFVPYTPPQRIVPQNRKPSIAAFNPALPPPKAPQSRPEPIRAPEPARAPEPIRAEPVREIARTPEPTRELPRPPPPPPTDGLDGLFAPPAPPSAPPGRPVGLDDLFGGPSEGRVKIPAAPAEPKKRKVTGGDKPPPAAKPPQQT